MRDIHGRIGNINKRMEWCQNANKKIKKKSSKGSMEMGNLIVEGRNRICWIDGDCKYGNIKEINWCTDTVKVAIEE